MFVNSLSNLHSIVTSQSFNIRILFSSSSVQRYSLCPGIYVKPFIHQKPAVMWQIEFEFDEQADNRAIKLQPGKYKASVEELSTDPVQYRVFNFNPAPSKTLREMEDQLLLMRLKKKGLEVYEWMEVFNNSSSELAQVIGKKIEEKMRQPVS
jgi:hypothetical protein